LHHKIKHLTKKTVSSIVSAQSMLNSLLKDEAIGGKLIIAFAAIAIILVNSPLKDTYDAFWHLSLSIGLGNLSLSQDLRHWVNEGLMALFFLVVGLEIKRELVSGELRDMKKAILPIAAAIGGMIVPAIIYLAFNLNSDAVQGWGVPIATDIAFAVAVLALLGNRVPLTLKLFLLTLAIVDDIGAILVIALFYAEILNYWYLACTFGLILAIWLMRKWLTNKLAIVIALGVTLWITAHLAGIHASIVGAVMGLLAPVPRSSKEPSHSRDLEEFFLPITTFFVLPVFALANAGVVLSSSVFQFPDSKSIMAGIIAGLIIGKLVGISGAAWLMVRFGLAKLPTGVGWLHVIGVSIIAGIGFTVSIFITELAFVNESQVEIAKISIFIASGLAALIGSLFLLKAKEIKQILDENTN
jgi:Na+:H+ antiporter, NhaA family